MPIKVKKEKKIKQKQKQSQKQIVNIKIGDVKKPVRRRRGVKKVDKVALEKPTIQYMYQATGSQPAKQNIGSPEPQARPNLLGGEIVRPEDVGQVRAEEALQIGRGSEARPSVLGGGFYPTEEVARQRILRLDTPLRVRQPEEPSLYSDFPTAETINIEGENPFRAGIEEEVNIEPLKVEFGFERLSSGSRQTEVARNVRRAMQISEGRGSDVPIELLIQGIYQNAGQPRRSFPTINQRERLFNAGFPIQQDREGISVRSKKKKSI